MDSKNLVIDKNKESILEIIFIKYFRISDVIKWVLIAFSGFILGISNFDIKINLISFLIFIFSSFFVFSFTFAINNFYDADSDRENPRRKNVNAIASGKISKKTGKVLNFFLAIIPMIICIFYKIELFILCFTFLFIVWSYSAPPFRLKGRPPTDVIWHFFGFVVAVLFGTYFSGSINTLILLFALSLGIFSTVGQLGNHYSDYNFDKSSGTKTFAVWIGLEKTKKTINVLTFIHLIFLLPLIFFYSLTYYITIAILIIIPLLGLILLKPKRGTFPTKRCFVYYFTIVIGGAVYLSVLIYHILLIFGRPTIELLNFLGIS